MILKASLDVLIEREADICDHLSDLRDGYQLESISYRLRSRNYRGVWVESSHSREEQPLVPEYPFFRKCLTVWSDQVRHSEGVLAEALYLGKLYRGLVYNPNTHKAITSFLGRTFWAVGLPISSGILDNTESEKSSLLERWQLSEEECLRYVPFLKDSSAYFSESGIILTHSDIFGFPNMDGDRE